MFKKVKALIGLFNLEIKQIYWYIIGNKNNLKY